MRIKKDFVVRALVLLLILTFLVKYYPDYAPLPHVTSLCISYLMSFYIGSAPIVQDNKILLNINDQIVTLIISSECSGIIVMMLFIAVIFLTPKMKLKHRFYSVLFMPILFIANILRITSEIFVGDIFNVDAMLIYHSSVGQIFFFCAVVLCYIIFLKMCGYFRTEKIKPSPTS